MENLNYLEKFYEKLYANLIKKYKKEKCVSLLIWFFDIKSNDRFRLLKDSSIEKRKIPKEVFNDLMSNKFIRETDTLGEYTITAQGMWEIETKKNVLSNKILLENLDDKYFNTYDSSEKNLSEKHKIIILSMIAARSFSEKSTVDLKKNNSALDAWESIIKESYELLKKLELVNKLSEDMLFGKQGNEHKVSNVFRHTDNIPKQTKGIFKASGNQKYYLDLYHDERVSIENLKYLFQKIFERKQLTELQRDMIYNFCTEISTNKNIYIFNIEHHIFHNPKYDLVIRDALLTL